MARKKRFINKANHKRRTYFSLLFVFILIIGIGFANLVSHLEIKGSLAMKGMPSWPDDTWEEIVENVENGRIQYYA